MSEAWLVLGAVVAFGFALFMILREVPGRHVGRAGFVPSDDVPETASETANALTGSGVAEAFAREEGAWLLELKAEGEDSNPGCFSGRFPPAEARRCWRDAPGCHIGSSV